MRRKPLFGFPLVVVLAAMSSTAGCDKQSVPASVPYGVADSYAIEHVTVLPMTGEASAISDVTVVVSGGWIEALGPSDTLDLSPDIRRIDGSGKWLMPALSDMHVHVENERLIGLLWGMFLPERELADAQFSTQDISAPYVGSGVLQIMNMSAMSEDLKRRDEVHGGRVAGPRMALAAMVDGTPSTWPQGMTRVAADPEQGREVVREVASEGYDFVKVYSMLDLATYSAILEEAEDQGLRVLGHLPEQGEGHTEKLLKPPFAMVAHAEEFAYQSPDMSDEEIRRYAALAKRTDTWLTSTLRTNELIAQQSRDPEILASRPGLSHVHPAVRAFWEDGNPYVASATPERIERLEAVVDFNRRLVRAFVEAGVPVVPGTDALVPGVVPGFTLHEELQALVSAGMTNEQALMAATYMSAKWLGVAEERGTVSPGKRADLMLLNANPLEDIANTGNIDAVVVNGKYLSRGDLDRMLGEQVSRYEDMAIRIEASR